MGMAGIWSLKSHHSCSQYKGNDYLHKGVMLYFVGCDLLIYLNLPSSSMRLHGTWPSKLHHHCHLQFKSSSLLFSLSISHNLFIISFLSLYIVPIYSITNIVINSTYAALFKCKVTECSTEIY